MTLILTPNIPDPDGFYDDLLAQFDGLSDAEAEALKSRLILILANHIGDRSILEAAFAAASTSEAGNPADRGKSRDPKPE